MAVDKRAMLARTTDRIMANWIPGYDVSQSRVVEFRERSLRIGLLFQVLAALVRFGVWGVRTQAHLVCPTNRDHHHLQIMAAPASAYKDRQFLAVIGDEVFYLTTLSSCIRLIAI